MIFKNEMAFKARMKNIAKEKGLLSQQVQQSYLIERFLVKLANSNYADRFIVKGGFLIGNLVGIDSRSTMDLDTTIKGFDLTKEKLTSVIEEILSVKSTDSFNLKFVGVEDIRDFDDYPGYRVKIRAVFGYIDEQITVDVTTGDRITPSEVPFNYQMIFEEQQLLLKSYNLETILAEKIETIMSRREANTRPRDYYDLYILHKLYHSKIDIRLLREALKETAAKRGTEHLISEVPIVIQTISNSALQRSLWSKYQKQYSYAQGLSFTDVIENIHLLLNSVITSTS